MSNSGSSNNRYYPDKDQISQDSSALRKGLERLWKSEKFCDVALKVGDRRFRCHRAVLAAASPVFEWLFERERKSEVPVEIIGVKSDEQYATLQNILQFVYNSTDFQLTTGNAFHLLRGADFFQVRWTAL